MANLDLMIKAWDTCHFELGEAFKGLPDEDVWRRAHPRLLSFGELVGHMMYWEAVRFTGPNLSEDLDLSEVGVKSPLVDHAFRYYTSNVENTKALSMGAEEMWAEVQRIHAFTKAVITNANPDSEDPIPSQPKSTWGFALEYQVFHLGYHTGQCYSVRHLLGHETVDN
ncbi:MAG: DinB family protein [Armatimonadetes bacterium]|nr:DinB family protein [Armatimonadota bacterium]